MSFRVQGKDFQNIKSDLFIVSYMISSNGNIRANMKSKSKFYCSGKRRAFHHWLNDEEMLRFHESSYYRNNNPSFGIKEDFENKIRRLNLERGI